MQVFTYQVMNCIIGIRDMTGKLLAGQFICHERERLRFVIAWLFFNLRVIDRPSIQSGWGSCFEPFNFEAEAMKCAADAGRGAFAGPSPSRALAFLLSLSLLGAGGRGD